MNLARQIRRQINLFRNLRNPQTYLVHKYGLRRRDVLFLKLRNGVVAEVPARMLHTFKESVLAQDYLTGFPREIADRFDGATVVDVGANAGYFSLWWLSRFPRGKVVAVEPMPNNFALLARNRALNPGRDFQAVNCAVQSRSGTVTLNFDRSDSFTTSASIRKGAGGGDEISVPAISLKQLMADFGLARVDFLKLDCEGSEYDILYNCGDAVLDSIRAIGMETHRGNGASETKDALCDYLRTKKFDVRTKPGSDMVHAWQ
jgi:FkbM family methyltransferase